MKSDLRGTRLLRPWGDCSDCRNILCAGKKILPCVRRFLSYLLSICVFILTSGTTTASKDICPESIQKVAIIKDTWVSAVKDEQYGNNGAENSADHVVRWGRQHVLQRKMRVAERPGGVLEPGMCGHLLQYVTVAPNVSVRASSISASQ